jgi:hypothetical protein
MVVFFQAFINTKYLLVKHKGEAFLESITVKLNQTQLGNYINKASALE